MIDSEESDQSSALIRDISRARKIKDKHATDHSSTNQSAISGFSTRRSTDQISRAHSIDLLDIFMSSSSIETSALKKPAPIELRRQTLDYDELKHLRIFDENDQPTIKPIDAVKEFVEEISNHPELWFETFKNVRDQVRANTK